MKLRLKKGYTRSNRDYGDKGRVYRVVDPYGVVVMQNDGSSMCELQAGASPYRLETSSRWEFNVNPTGKFDVDYTDDVLEAACHREFIAKGFESSSAWELDEDADHVDAVEEENEEANEDVVGDPLGGLSDHDAHNRFLEDLEARLKPGWVMAGHTDAEGEFQWLVVDQWGNASLSLNQDRMLRGDPRIVATVLNGVVVLEKYKRPGTRIGEPCVFKLDELNELVEFTRTQLAQKFRVANEFYRADPFGQVPASDVEIQRS
jgi:hypothetical protein